MKNKMLARRIAIAMLSAGMVMTTVPVSTFAADVVSVEASDANAYGGQSVTDDAFKTALTTAVTGLSGYTLTSKSSASDLSAIANSINRVSAMSTGSYSITNLKITGATAPTYQTTAKGGALVMPVVTITADVYKGSTTAWGTCTFTLDASALTKKEQITAAEAIVEGAGGKSDVDPNADKYANEDNSSKLADYVGELLATSKIVVAGTSTAAGTKLENIKVGTTTDGTNKTAAVSQSAITPATKAAAGSEAVAVTFDIKLTKAVDSTDPDWDNTAADQNADQHLTGSASYTATIKKLGVTSDDADYQAKVEQALSAVTFTNQNFVGAIKSGNKGAAFTSTDTTIASNGGITADATVTKALASVGVYEANNAGSNLAITYRNFTAASHKADGSVTILLDQKRDQADGTTKHAYATVTVPVTHADDTVAIGDEISAKIVALVKAYVADSKDITPTTLDATAQKKEITAKLQAAVEKALSDTLEGTNTIASEIEKVEVSIPDGTDAFEASTATSNGKLKNANFTVTFKNDAPATTDLTNPGAGFDAEPVSGKKNQLVFSYDSTGAGEITLYKVSAVAATSLTLPDETPYNTLTADDDGNGEIKVTPTFTPAASNNYVIRWTLSDNSKFKFKDGASWKTYADAKTNSGIPNIDNANDKTAFLANDGITLTVSAKAGDTATLTAELIDSDGLVAAKATTTLKAVKGFSDVQNTHDYAYNAINELAKSYTVYKNGKWEKDAVIGGVGNNLFDPNSDVTRAQFVTFLYRLAQTTNGQVTTTYDTATVASGKYNGVDAKYADGSTVTDKTYVVFNDADASTKFTDVDANAYYAKAVDWAVANGITSGKTDTTFDPNGKVTRAEAVTFLYRYFAANQSYNAANFSDVSSTAYYANAVGWASSEGVTQGKSATTFAPSDTTTRKEAAAFIYRAMTWRNGHGYISK